MINPANRTERIWMMGALMMTITKTAALGGALVIDAVKCEPFEGGYVGRW